MIEHLPLTTRGVLLSLIDARLALHCTSIGRQRCSQEADRFSATLPARSRCNWMSLQDADSLLDARLSRTTKESASLLRVARSSFAAVRHLDSRSSRSRRLHELLLTSVLESSISWPKPQECGPLGKSSDRATESREHIRSAKCLNWSFSEIFRHCCSTASHISAACFGLQPQTVADRNFAGQRRKSWRESTPHHPSLERKTSPADKHNSTLPLLDQRNINVYGFAVSQNC